MMVPKGWKNESLLIRKDANTTLPAGLWEEERSEGADQGRTEELPQIHDNEGMGMVRTSHVTMIMTIISHE